MKKNTVKKSVMATVLAASLFSSTGVGFASSSLQDLVDQARKDMKEASYAYVVPAQKGKITTSKDLYPALNTAKESYQKAKNAIEKSKAANKKALLNDLEDLYNERIAKGVIPYIDAYNYATEYLNPIMEAIEKAETAKDSAEVGKQLQKLSDQLNSRSAIMYRFTGKAPRDLLLTKFKTPADKKHAQLAAYIPSDVEPTNFELSIIHTNDTHAAIENAPKRATIIKDVRKEKPNALLLDAGDVFQGTLYFTEYQGEADLALMNYMGYDAMTLGNHEFDLGKTAEGHQALANFVKNAKFPIVTANVDFSKDEKLAGLHKETIAPNATPGNIYDGTIIEVDGEKVGIFGLTTETTAGSSSPNKVTFEDYLKEAEKAVASLEAQGVDKNRCTKSLRI
ncbi:metallophosphoesterase [Psychrobacillus sp. NPDC096426]|uniref:metallophosphoesterase n=1 Tax=Psychrobacillus sp. NPDC096426 TaxID=3364491 RepID=UPI00380E53EC